MMTMELASSSLEFTVLQRVTSFGPNCQMTPMGGTAIRPTTIAYSIVAAPQRGVKSWREIRVIGPPPGIGRRARTPAGGTTGLRLVSAEMGCGLTGVRNGRGLAVSPEGLHGAGI